MKRAVILAGGEGTRLRPYTTVLPKPLMPIGDRPVLDIVVRQLKAHGFEHITMATGYLAELIEAFFRDGESYGVKIDYFREREPLGTVGALALIDGIGDDDVLVMNGDVLTDIDYGALLARHAASRCGGDDRDQEAPHPGLAGRPALRRRRRPDAADRLRREAGDRLHRLDGRLLLRAAGAERTSFRTSGSTSPT